MPEFHQLPSSLHARRPSPAALFRHGLALRTTILWMINLFNLVGNYSILFWLPGILHAHSLSASKAILAITMYAFGMILCALITVSIADRLGIERGIAAKLCVGASCVLLVGTAALPYPALCGDLWRLHWHRRISAPDQRGFRRAVPAGDSCYRQRVSAGNDDAGLPQAQR